MSHNERSGGIFLTIAVILGLAIGALLLKNTADDSDRTKAMRQSWDAGQRPGSVLVQLGGTAQKVPTSIEEVNKLWSKCGRSCAHYSISRYPVVYELDVLPKQGGCRVAHPATSVRSINLAATAGNYAAKYVKGENGKIIRLCPLGGTHKDDVAVIWSMDAHAKH